MAIALDPVVSHSDAWQVTVFLTFDRCAISGGAPLGPEFYGVNGNCLRSCGQSRGCLAGDCVSYLRPLRDLRGPL